MRLIPQICNLPVQPAVRPNAVFPIMSVSCSGRKALFSRRSLTVLEFFQHCFTGIKQIGKAVDFQNL